MINFGDRIMIAFKRCHKCEGYLDILDTLTLGALALEMIEKLGLQEELSKKATKQFGIEVIHTRLNDNGD